MALIAALQKSSDLLDETLLERIHLLELDDSRFLQSPYLLAETYATSPEVGSMIYSQLLVSLAEASGEQRHRTHGTAIRWTVSDVGQLASGIIGNVKVDDLSEAAAAGVVETVGFQSKTDLSPESFFRGVDVEPAHITSGLDIPRPNVLEAIMTGLRESRYVLLSGPSGSGKSAALWRGAAELSVAMRVLRVRRASNQGELQLLLRHIRMLKPSTERPVLICCDNVGRHPLEFWPGCAERLLELPGTYLLSAAREEDLLPNISFGPARIVGTALDSETARRIHVTLRVRGFEIGAAFEEAWARSKGLLLEFIATATDTRRLDSVVGAQAMSRFGEASEREFDLLRFVCTAHVAGFVIPSGSLVDLLELPAARFRLALQRLSDEHVLLQDEAGAWTGMHELRSEVMVRELHKVPPPRLEETVVSLVCRGPVDAIDAAPLYLARTTKHVPASVLDAVEHRIGSLDASGLLSVARAALRIDAHLTASIYVDLVRDSDLPHLDLHTRVFLGLGVRTVPSLASFLLPTVVELGNNLPEAVTIARSRLWEAIRVRRVVEIVGDSKDALAALLEALELLQVENIVPAEEMAEAANAGLLDARFAGSCQQLCSLEATSVSDLFGPLSDRLKQAAVGLPLCSSHGVRSEADGLVVSVELMADLAGKDVHESALEACRRMRETCPEADHYEVVTVWPRGERYSFSNHEPGHKRMPKKNLPRDRNSRFRVAVLEEVSRITSSKYWTEWIRAVSAAATLAARLVEEVAVRLLNAGDSSTRRSVWSSEVQRLVRAVAELPRPPDPGVEPADTEGLRKVLEQVATALTQFDEGTLGGGGGTILSRIGWQLRRACSQYRRAVSSGFPTMSDEPEPLPEQLFEACEVISTLLLTWDTTAQERGRSCKRTTETWFDAARRIREYGCARVKEEEQRRLRTMLDTCSENVDLRLFPSEDWDSPHAVTDIWIVASEEEVTTGLVAAVQEAVAAAGPSLVGRVYLIQSVGDLIVPLGFVFYADKRLPLLADRLEELSRWLNLRWPSGSMRDAVERFLGAAFKSSAGAWLADKRYSSLDTGRDSADFFHEAECVWRRVEPELSPELTEGLREVLEALEDELRNGDAGRLAYSLLGSSEADALAERVMTLRFKAIDDDESARTRCAPQRVSVLGATEPSELRERGPDRR